MLRTSAAVARLLLVPALALVATSSRRTPVLYTLPKPLALYQADANQAYLRGEFGKSAEICERALHVAKALHDRKAEARFLLGRSNAESAVHSYQSAIADLLQARNIAERESDDRARAVISLALYSIAYSSGDLLSSEAYLRKAQQLQASLDPSSRTRLFLDLGMFESHAGSDSQAKAYFEQAVDSAYQSGEIRMAAAGWKQIGVLLMSRGRFADAEPYLIEAYRLRRIFNSRELPNSYIDLAHLRIAEGNIAAGEHLADLALAGDTKTADPIVDYAAYHARALAHVRQGNFHKAFDDFDEALARGRKYYVSLYPSESVRNPSNVWLQQVYDDYVAAGVRYLERTNDPAFAAKLFLTVEENRALSLREKILNRPSVPDGYWETLSRLRSEEIRAVVNGRQEQSTLSASLRVQLAELESQAGATSDLRKGSGPAGQASNTVENSIRTYQKLLAPSEALISFHLGDSNSCAWILTRERLQLRLLPERRELTRKVAELSRAIAADSPDVDAVSRSLYRAFFGFTEANSKPDWIISLDDALFDVPFAALVVSPPPASIEYLIERHTIRTVPAAAVLGYTRTAPSSGRLLAVGDPIFNHADPRWSVHPNKHATAGFSFFTTMAGTEGAGELARLPGTHVEVNRCARVWRNANLPAAANVLLEGAAVRRPAILRELANSPEIVHFATHVTQSGGENSSAYLALGLDENGRPDFLTEREISALRCRLGLVVLSACSSGAGKTLPGAGLFGLTRAWLLAGAEAVLATEWPTSDDSGAIFEPFYAALNGTNNPTARDAAKALRSAQLAMLRAGGWRARPIYWAPFFVFGKD